MKTLIKKIPLLNSLAKVVYFYMVAPFKSFAGSKQYWQQRYQTGGNSGDGSFKQLAEFKAEILNQFIHDKQIKTVIEYGCGDGNQLKLAKYPHYIGFDISLAAIQQCQHLFADDQSKSFKLIDDYQGETAELVLSLDVIYHLIEDEVFLDYMQRLLASSEKFVIIYSSNTDKQQKLQAAHVKHRQFSQFIEQQGGWRLLQHIPNKYPETNNTQTGSFADFYLYEKIEQG